jgi:hypothetical protein
VRLTCTRCSRWCNVVELDGPVCDRCGIPACLPTAENPYIAPDGRVWVGVTCVDQRWTGVVSDADAVRYAAIERPIDAQLACAAEE